MDKVCRRNRGKARYSMEEVDWIPRCGIVRTGSSRAVVAKAISIFSTTTNRLSVGMQRWMTFQ